MEPNNKETSQLVLDRLAFLVSALLSPYIICAAFSTWIISRYAKTPHQFMILTATFLGLAVALPLVFVVIRVAQGSYSDIHVAILEQREEIFKVATVGAGLLSLIYYAEAAPIALIGMTLTLFANGLIFWAISRRWKISMHAAAITQAGVVGVILFSWSYLFWLLLLPVVTWARLRRKRHTVFQALGAVLVVSVTTPLIFWSIGVL